ncbi:hypothetical protein ACB092_08G038700 [Castanea dentata]
MDGAIVANSIGLFGGLWVLWDSEQVELSDLSSTEQEIHALMTSTARPPWLLSAICASPRFAERQLLWDNLAKVAGLHSLPWVIAGDFNEILTNGDKFGGNPVSVSRALRFQECLNSCRMIDISFNGPRYTWSNYRPLSQLIQGRIDRVFVNPVWNSLFPEAAVFHLEKTHFDHCPIKLCLESNQGFHPLRPFKFQPIWLSHPTFPELVRDTWVNPLNFQMAISSFSEQATVWNRTHFGNLFQRKNRILAGLKGIQKSLTMNSNSFLINLEKKITSRICGSV